MQRYRAGDNAERLHPGGRSAPLVTRKGRELPAGKASRPLMEMELHQ